MKELMILSIIILLMSSCDNDSNDLLNTINTDIPVCVQGIIDNPEQSSDLKTIKVQEVNGELHYWLNTDFTHFDGVEFILNSNCNVICSFCGEYIPAECIDEYDTDWIIIWEK